MDSTQSSRARKPRRAPLRKVGRGWTALPNALLLDAGLTYLARGILVSLLARPEGWDVRAAAIVAASPGRESLAAVRRALRELGAAGYYRIVRERQANPQGKLVWVTETWVSLEPSPDWRAEWGTRKGRPVVLRHAPAGPPQTAPAAPVAQPDATFVPGAQYTGITPPRRRAGTRYCAQPGHEFQVLTVDGRCALCVADQLAGPSL